MPNDRLECADADFSMIRDGHRDGAGVGSPLQDDMTAALADDVKPMLFEDTADISPGEDAELTHAPLQNG